MSEVAVMPPKETTPAPTVPKGLRSRRCVKSRDFNVPSEDKWTASYGHYNKGAYKPDGAGSLQQPASVTVMDYGVKGSNRDELLLFLNGKKITAPESNPDEADYSVECKNAKDFSALLIDHGDWGDEDGDNFIRWIDVEGVNGPIIQKCLEIAGCFDQSFFNMAVDPHQQSICLDFDPDDPGHSVMFLALKVALTDFAFNLLYEDAKLYGISDLCEDGISVEETVVFLIKMTSDRRTGLILTLQRGMSDDIFKSMQIDIMTMRQKVFTQDAAQVLMRLNRADVQSLFEVVNYMESAAEQLDLDLKEAEKRAQWSKKYTADEDASLLPLLKGARLLEAESESLSNKCSAVESTLSEFANDYGGLHGDVAAAWKAIVGQHRSAVARARACQRKSAQLVHRYKDLASKRLQQWHARHEALEAQAARGQTALGLVLAVFSPLSFVAGVYGMNFTKPDGNPGMPELAWGWELNDPDDPDAGFARTKGVTGYGYFWILVGSIAVGVILLYIYLGLIVFPELPASMTRRAKDDAAKPTGPAKNESPSPPSATRIPPAKVFPTTD